MFKSARNGQFRVMKLQKFENFRGSAPNHPTIPRGLAHPAQNPNLVTRIKPLPRNLIGFFLASWQIMQLITSSAPCVHHVWGFNIFIIITHSFPCVCYWEPLSCVVCVCMVFRMLLFTLGHTYMTSTQNPRKSFERLCSGKNTLSK